MRREKILVISGDNIRVEPEVDGKHIYYITRDQAYLHYMALAELKPQFELEGKDITAEKERLREFIEARWA